jgi:hypothetical protein
MIYKTEVRTTKFCNSFEFNKAIPNWTECKIEEERGIIYVLLKINNEYDRAWFMYKIDELEIKDKEIEDKILKNLIIKSIIE